jgi:hypothetical protein
MPILKGAGIGTIGETQLGPSDQAHSAAPKPQGPKNKKESLKLEHRVGRNDSLIICSLCAVCYHCNGYVLVTDVIR